MVYDPRKHHRRSIRLRGYDYAGGGAYFITICVHGKECLFGQVVESEMNLNDAGRIVQGSWEALPCRFPSVILDAFQIMPNHLHGIFVIRGSGLEPSLAASTGAPVIEPRATTAGPGTASRTPTAMGDVAGAFKSVSAIAVNRFLHRTGQSLWQENFFEHIIRNVDSLEKIRDYIAHNPAQWLKDPENPDHL